MTSHWYLTPNKITISEARAKIYLCISWEQMGLLLLSFEHPRNTWKVVENRVETQLKDVCPQQPSCSCVWECSIGSWEHSVGRVENLVKAVENTVKAVENAVKAVENAVKAVEDAANAAEDVSTVYSWGCTQWKQLRTYSERRTPIWQWSHKATDFVENSKF